QGRGAIPDHRILERVAVEQRQQVRQRRLVLGAAMAVAGTLVPIDLGYQVGEYVFSDRVIRFDSREQRQFHHHERYLYLVGHFASLQALVVPCVDSARVVDVEAQVASAERVDVRAERFAEVDGFDPRFGQRRQRAVDDGRDENRL